MYTHAEVSSAWSNLDSHFDSHSWKLPSVTGPYAFDSTVKFANYPEFTYAVATTSADWTQACLIQVDKVEFEGFTRSVYVDETSSTSATATLFVNATTWATLFVNATSTGDCGGEYSIVATLVAEDLTSVSVPLDQSLLLSKAGQTVTVNIDRDESAYTFSASVTATAAPETVEQHQADT